MCAGQPERFLRRNAALAEVADALLSEYYDGMYAYQRTKRPGEQREVRCDGGDAFDNARHLLEVLTADTQ